MVAIKTLIIVHRALREVDHSFREELIGYRLFRGHMLNLSNFKDDSSSTAWEYSTWIRIYALYLEERLECFFILKCDFQRDHLRTKRLDTPDLLEQLPSLQRLLFRLLACQPVGVARYNFIIQYALSIVAAESVRLYVAITDGVLNLVDKFFEMNHSDAVKALEIYRKSGDQAERLSQFFEICRGFDFGRGQKYVKIEQPPASFIAAMEEYAVEAPQTLMLPWRMDDGDKCATVEAIAIPESSLGTDPEPLIEAEESHPSVDSPKIPKTDKSEAADTPLIPDLMSWDDAFQEAPEPDDNSLALSTSTTEEVTGWELALTTASGSDAAAVSKIKLGVGLDRLTLDSLYDAALSEANTNASYHGGMVLSNPFEDDSMAQPNYLQITEIPRKEQAGILQEAFFQQYHHQMINMQMIEMFQQEALTQKLDQQPNYVHLMTEFPYQEEALTQQLQNEQSLVGHDSTNPFGNPFLDEDFKSCPTQEQSPDLSLI